MNLQHMLQEEAALKCLAAKPCTTLNLSIFWLHCFYLSIRCTTCITCCGGKQLPLSTTLMARASTYRTEGTCGFRVHLHTCNKPFYFLSVCCGYHPVFYILFSFYKLWFSLANATYCLAIRTVPCTIRLRVPIRLHPDQLLLPAVGSRQCMLVFEFRAHPSHP